MHLTFTIQIFIICFSLDDRISYENVTNVWHPEILPHLQAAQASSNGETPSQPARIILVGTKVDLREADSAGDSSQFVAAEEGSKLAGDIHADTYIECSAKMEKNVKKVFDEAVRAFLKVWILNKGTTPTLMTKFLFQKNG